MNSGRLASKSVPSIVSALAFKAKMYMTVLALN